MKRLYYCLISHFFLFSQLVFFTEFVYAQYEELPDSRLQQIADTLRFGIDDAIEEAIETLIILDTNQFTAEILERIESSSNADVILAAIRYFRHYELADGIPFALRSIENFNDLPTNVVQHILFYLGDFSSQLQAEGRTQDIIDALDAIILSDRTGVVLAALELLPSFYSEADISYAEAKEILLRLEEEQEAELGKFEDAGDTILLEEEPIAEEEGAVLVTDGVEEQPLPYSISLREHYDATRVQVTRAEFLITFAKIQAYTMIDFIIELASDESVAMPQRISAVRALGYYEEYPDTELQQSVFDLLEKLKDTREAGIRAAAFTALQHMNTEPFITQQVLGNRLLAGLKDNDEEVRMATLEAISVKIENNPTLFSSLDFFPYMIENDPSNDVRRKALSLYISIPNNREGKRYLIDSIRNVRSFNSKTKPYLEEAFNDIDDLEILEAVVELCRTHIEQNISFLLRSAAEIAAQYKNVDLDRLVDVLKDSPDSEVIYHVLNIISKNRFRAYAPYVTGVSRDRTKSFKVRLHAKTVLELLQRSEN